MTAAAVVAALRAPIDQLRAAVGSTTAGLGTATALDEARTLLSDIAVAGQRAWAAVAGVWSGMSAEQVGGFIAETVLTVDRLATDGTRLFEATHGACEAVARAGREIDAIAADFTAQAEPMAVRLEEPGVPEALAALARRALDEAVAVVERLRAELDGHAKTVIGPTGGPRWSERSSSGPSPTWSPSPVDFATHHELAKSPSDFGAGVAVTLPDGSTVAAPNSMAASAVRHALTQLGVPYDWGGTTPGVGLDCSGLTQWAYSEAGLGLPRLAQEQDVGAAVSPASLLPGDLAVWDGHVAMVVGNGLMIEAGDPVELSPIRTTNSAQGFQGFWRPTA